MIERIHLAGVPIDPMDAREAALWALNRLKSGVRTTATHVNAAVVAKASREPALRQVLEEFDLALADGLWPAFAATCLFRSQVPKTCTSFFLKALFRESSPDCLRVFLLGARPEVVKRAAAKLPRFYSNANVVGYRDGYFEPHEETSIVDTINKSRADILLLGIPSPKRELFIQRNWEELTVLMSIGPGGLFDIWAGDIKEPPNWIRKFGLAWLFRLCQEPRRLWKRYTITNLRFILLVLKEAFSMLFHRGQWCRPGVHAGSSVKQKVISDGNQMKVWKEKANGN